MSNMKRFVAVKIAVLGTVVTAFVLVGLFFGSRFLNQRAEDARIRPIISDSREHFADSMERGGRTVVATLLENYRDEASHAVAADHGISLLVTRDGKSY